jgi:hypothetical protein
MSCTGNDSLEEEPFAPINELTVKYKGYYEEFFELPIANSTFNNIKVTHIVEQVSATEHVDLLQIFANANNDNDNYIAFRVLKDQTGTNVLYNNSFSFKSHGAIYYQSNLKFEVLKNNGTEFSAQFSGELDHWYNGEKRYIYLNIFSGSIVLNY